MTLSAAGPWTTCVNGVVRNVGRAAVISQPDGHNVFSVLKVAPFFETLK